MELFESLESLESDKDQNTNKSNEEYEPMPLQWIPDSVILGSHFIYFFFTFSTVFISKFFVNLLKPKLDLTHYLIILPVVVSSGSNIAMYILSILMSYIQEIESSKMNLLQFLPKLMLNALFISFILFCATFIATHFLKTTSKLVWITGLTLIISSLIVTLSAIIYSFIILQMYPDYQSLVSSLTMLSNDVFTTFIFFGLTLYYNE